MLPLRAALFGRVSMMTTIIAIESSIAIESRVKLEFGCGGMNIWC